jgi:hypothetical protein
MDIGRWLRSLGLERYEAAFRDNEIDDSVLPTITAEDLKDLGVEIVGHRRKLLNAVAALRTDAGAKQPITETPSKVETRPQDTAERRQVTVMFSDLVGSTALSGRMDPEDLREVISAYQKCVADTVQRFSGFVAKYMGDGVLVYFGYPQAHEDDAERAVRAGLELIQAAALSGRMDPEDLISAYQKCVADTVLSVAILGDLLRRATVCNLPLQARGHEALRRHQRQGRCGNRRGTAGQDQGGVSQARPAARPGAGAAAVEDRAWRDRGGRAIKHRRRPGA